MKLVNLIPLKEIDFRNQDQFDDYAKQHSLRPDTKVTIAGKVTTAGKAAQKSEPTKGSSVFGKDKGASIFDKPKADTKPKEVRKGNPTVNKDAKKKAEEFGITPQKLGNEEYPKTMLKAAVEALTDSNFHDEARQLVATIEGKPEWAKRVNYPSMDDPKYKEKMADLRKNGVDSSKYWRGDNNSHEFGRKVSAGSGWNGADAADGIAFTLRMNGFHKQADMIQSVFDEQPSTK